MKSGYLRILYVPFCLLVSLLTAGAAMATESVFPASIQTVLENTKPLKHPRNGRLPLLLWPTLGGVVEDDGLQEAIIRELDQRGISMIATWDYGKKEISLAQSLRIAAIQQKLGLPVVVNANACMYSFFNGDPRTSHIDSEGNRFFDQSFGKGHKIGCAFSLDFRLAAMTEQIDYFVRSYKRKGLPLDLVWGDWEIDGPLEFNRSWEAAKCCATCRKHVTDIEDFESYQRVMRLKRAEITRRCYSEPILSRYPKALVGNYAVYPHDGHRYWWDYFEYFVDYHPHIVDQGARYRKWFHEFALTGYTFAMPTVYPWHDTFLWYDFEDPDYRWFYNMLLVASNAGQHTDPKIPIIAFVHWHTVVTDGKADPSVKQMGERAYKELLWHMLLRGTDGLFMWCPAAESAEETRIAHEVYAASLGHSQWLNRGTPITFAVPKQTAPVISGLRIANRVLVRRTDFSRASSKPVEIRVDGKTLIIPPNTHGCVVLPLK